MIVDDVISAGTSVRESVEMLRAAGATPVAVLIALDRMEKAAPGGQSCSSLQFRRWKRLWYSSVCDCDFARLDVNNFEHNLHLMA